MVLYKFDYYHDYDYYLSTYSMKGRVVDVYEVESKVGNSGWEQFARIWR